MLMSLHEDINMTENRAGNFPRCHGRGNRNCSFTSTPEYHTQKAGNFLTLVQKRRMTLGLMNCHFFSDTIGLLGHVIGPGKFLPATWTNSTVQTLKLPTAATELLSFLNLRIVYRMFVPRFARKLRH